MADEERLPIEQVLPAMGLHPLQQGWTPVEAFVLIKCFDEDGGPSWVYRTTAVPNQEELLGALIVHTDLLRRKMVRDWEDPSDD